MKKSWCPSPIFFIEKEYESSIDFQHWKNDFEKSEFCDSKGQIKL